MPNFVSISRVLILSLAAAIFTFLLSPATVRISRLTGAFDIPDGKRKIHTSTMPRLGGLGFFAAFFICLVLLIISENIPIASPNSGFIAALLSGGAILAAGGVSDDTIGLPPMVKLLLQISAVLVTMLFLPMPPYFSVFGLLNIPLNGIIGFLFASGRLLFTINAVNFSDGLDGLASGLSIVALGAISIYAGINGKPIPAAVALILASAVIGFLPYNRYHAKIYMGDVGSQFLGLAIATLSLASSPNGGFTVETSLFLFIPMLDTTLSIARRILSGHSPFTADKGHLHHLLLKRGKSHPTAVKTLVAISALVALFTLLTCGALA